MAVAKMQVLHQLLKHDLLPVKSHSYKCPSCTQEVNPDDIDVVRNLTITETIITSAEAEIGLYIGIYFEEASLAK